MAKRTDSDRAEVRRKAVKAFMTEHKIESVNAWANDAKVSESGVRGFLKGDTDSLNLLTLEKLAEAKGATLVDILGLEPSLRSGLSRGPSSTHRVSRRPRSDPRQLALELPPLILEIEIRAGAGLGGEVQLDAFTDGDGNIVSQDAIRGEWLLPAEYLAAELRVAPHAARIIEVVGDSMSPTLETGDRVMINTADRRPSPGGIFALWDGLGVVIKRLEHIPNSDPAALRISSDNPKHATYERTVDEVRIIGRAAWKGSRL